MPDIESLLDRWQTAGVLDREAADRIRAHERSQAAPDSPPRLKDSPAAMKWQLITALVLGGILVACGVVLFVSAHWDEMGKAGRFALVLAMVAVFHVSGGLTRANFRALSTVLHAVGTIATGAAIALTGQIFNIEEHWPAAVLMWAVAALAGWALLRDEAQQTLALLLLPAWMLSEISFRTNGHIREQVLPGQMLLVWAMLYLTFFIGSPRKVTQGILYSCSAAAAIVGIVLMLLGWTSWGTGMTTVPFNTQAWAWALIAALPLAIAAFHGHKGLIPVAVAIGFSIALPFCHRTLKELTYTRTEPNLAANLLVAAFAVFVAWWGVRQLSKMLVNLGIVGFAIAVVWFYFSDVFDKMGRSLGLIGLGVLFLAGGWALEKMRRRILARMGTSEAAI
jgi:uncharacterized membrane protein